MLTERVVRAVAANFGPVVMRLLLERTGKEMQITARILEAALDNQLWQEEMIVLLLE